MQSIYPNLKLPEFFDRPFYYSNFVSTIDGKVQVLENTKDYWPLGSELDYQTLIELRTYADVLIHGKNTALPHPTLQSLSKQAFWDAREKTGKSSPILYIVISNNPTNELISKLHSEHEKVKTMIITNENVKISNELAKATEIVRLGTETVDLNKLSSFLSKHGHKRVLVEGGPTLMGQFVKHDLLDEVFWTVAPKIIGSHQNTLTMVEGELLPPEEVKKFKLLSVKQVGEELYLRYRKI
jgi:riboflavin-specific deaminase-like protein